MAVKWTEAQNNAIDSRGRTLLVSAAAGSGKTAVLTARIIKRLTDPENPADISRMLVVTFTKAAAAELRERIQKALSAALAANPSNRALSRQAVKLGRAKICTIHSFCYDMIRTNFERLGIGANVRVADDTEIKIIYGDAMERTINELYDAQPDASAIKDFAAYADNFITDRDDRLNDIMNGIYVKVRSYPEGIGFIKKSADELFSASTKNFMSSRYGKIISADIKKQLAYFLSVYSDAVNYLTDGGVYAKNYLPAFEYDIEFIKSLCSALECGIYSDIRVLLNSYNRSKLGSGVKKDMQNEETDFFRKVRDDFNNQRKAVNEKYFASAETEISKNMLKTAQLCSDTYTLLSLFEDRLNAEKKTRGIVDYGDLEQMTYSLLYKDGVITDFARETAVRYDEIYIDEYQDVNELQDKIFTAVSNEHNRFMVGDIKQSIYGFRGASPGIFSDYRDRFPKYGDKESDANTLFLSDNFRCDRSIIEFTNIIFKCLFKCNSGNVPYYDEDRLIYSKNDDTHKKAVTEVAVIKNDKDTENDDGEDSSSGEAVYVVNKIRALIAEGYHPKDITILLRSAKNNAGAFETELAKLNLPYYNGVTRDFFENAEVLLMLCMLNCIDNPTRDIYLAGILKSPLYGVTLDELIQIRTHGGGGSLYDALKNYTEKYNFEKGSYFLDKLKNYRKYAEGQPVDRLIWFIYRDTAIMSLIYDTDKTGSGKNVRRSNLMLLYEYARRFEASSFRGLYNFIRYINDIIDERETLETAKLSSESDDAVKIMTIYQSKGLEFPVCFLCGIWARSIELLTVAEDS
jgi:ATP-dependent helicase/nuclease subunit A